ncbi:MAG TPA: GntR family transcriptional regulator [Spirochaetota bacterium]|nr:GntR family transcriptional regulator [Spirochaetota bacterium]HPQ51981.1 GntR family transcriptional regulator [Spirochaetota bacterium]
MKNTAELLDLTIEKASKSPHIPNLVVTQIVKLISGGVLKPGDKLPSELEMTRRFGISRISLREAMKLLEAKGYIESLGRKGKRIKSVVHNAVTSQIEELISVDQDNRWKLLNVRKILDSEGAFLAAAGASHEQIEKLENFRIESERIGIDNLVFREEGEKLYADFYKFVAIATNNTVFAHLMRSISQMLHHAIPCSRNILQEVENSSRFLYEQHCAILSAIQKGKPLLAKEAVVEHIEWLETVLREPLKV